MRKGGKKGSLAIHPQTAQRIRDYMEEAKHEDDMERRFFLPVEATKGRMNGGICTPVRSTAFCASMQSVSALSAGTRRTRCARRL